MDAVRRYFRDINRVVKDPHVDHAFTHSELNEIRKIVFKVDNKKKNSLKWNMYPLDVPIIYGSSSETLSGGKENIFRKKTMSKRSTNACRLTITVDPNLDPDEISLPKLVWTNIAYPKYVAAIRFPSLSILNLTVHRVSIHGSPSSRELCETIRIPPTICEGHHADFDGDAMTVIGLDKASAYEMLLLCGPKSNMQAERKLRLNFSRDAKIGLGFCNDGVTPFHKVITACLLEELWKGESAENVFKKFVALERLGLQNSTQACYGNSKSQIRDYSQTKCGKMSLAHFEKMFGEGENLANGVSRDTFIKQCQETRSCLLTTPTEASDHGCVFSSAFHCMRDALLAMDHSLRFHNGKIITPFPFYMHPENVGHKIDFPVYISEREREVMDSFKPYCTKLTLTPVFLKRGVANFVFQNILDCGLIKIFRIEGANPEEYCGTLHLTDEMIRLGLQANIVYLIKLHVVDDYYCGYVCTFKKME